MKTVLTIAGSDCSGGAGIQADLKTITAHKMYGMSAITALTAQNTMGVYSIMDVPPSFVAQQLDCIFTDIFPDSIKIGMVSNTQIIEIIAEKLIQYNAKNIVVDPVMVATSGSKLIADSAIKSLVKNIFPLADIITPNIPEAEALADMKIENENDMEIAVKKISKNISGSLLLKGGHLKTSANDLLYSKNQCLWYKSERIENNNTHGTGCTLSTSIACGLANNFSIDVAVGNAKIYLTGALKAGLDIGNGNGPVNHCYNIGC